MKRKRHSVSIAFLTNAINWSSDPGHDAVYVRSPLTASEEALQYLPGSRFLNTSEFKRVYLGEGESSSNTRDAARPSSATPADYTSAQRHASPRLTQRSAAPHAAATRITSSSSTAHHRGAVPRPPSAAAVPRSRNRTAARRLYGYSGGVHDAVMHLGEGKRLSPHATRTSARAARDPTTGQRPDVENNSHRADAAGGHPTLSQQLRCKVRAARRSPSAGAATYTGTDHLALGGQHTEDLWLLLQRELRDEKDKVRGLQRQLRRAQVLVRTLHGVTSEEDPLSGAVDDDEATDEGTALSTSAAPPTEAEGAQRAKKPHSGEQRPKDYWQRRAYFLEKQQEALTEEVEQLRRDARGSKVRAVLKELEVVRAQLKRYRSRRSPPTSARAKAPETMSGTGTAREVEEGSNDSGGDEVNDRSPSGPVAHRWSTQRLFASAAPTASDEVFLRQKDDCIRDLRERLRLLTQQYQKADAQVITCTRQIEDLTLRYNAVQVEWRALQHLPQELARVQQQLNTAQAQLLDSDREVEAFHQLFDTLESPATLRAVINERDHLVELLRLSQQQQAGLRDGMKASVQQAVLAAESKHHAQREEDQAMARDREAQQEQATRKLRRQIEVLEGQLAAQRQMYEAQLAENANEREAELTDRLLSSVAHGDDDGEESTIGTGVAQSNKRPDQPELSVSASRSLPHSVALSSRPPSRDGPRNAPAPRQTPGGDAGTPSSRSPLDSTSGLLVTRPSVHGSEDAVVQRRGSFSLSPEVDEVTRAPAVEETKTSGEAHDESVESSLTPSSDTASSTTEDTLTDTESEEDVFPAAKGKPSAASSAGVAAAGAGLPTLLSSSASKERPSAVTPVSGSVSGGDAAVVVHQELISSEVTDDGDAASHGIHSRSHINDNGASISSSATPDDVSGLDETIEKAGRPPSDSSSSPSPSPSSGSSTPPRGDHGVRIGFGFPKPHDEETPPKSGDGLSASSRRGPVFDFPAPPIAIVHPVSILINRASMDGLKFSDNLRAVVHSPAASNQQTATATATSDPTPSQPTLTDSDSDSADEEDEASSTYSHSSSSPSSGSSASPSTSLLPSAPAQPAAQQDDEAKASSQTEGPTPAAASASAALQASEEEAPMSAASPAEAPATPISSASSIRSGLQSALDDSLGPIPPIPTTDSPAPARPTHLVASDLSTAAVVPATAQAHALARTTVHTPTQSTVPALHASATSSPGAMPKSAPIPSPPAITPLVASSLYPPRTNSAQLLPPLNSEETLGDGGPHRGGASPRPASADHSSFDLAHQFSGNASFDFVGPLAERHRLEDMQNNFAFSQQTSPAALSNGGGGVASPFPSVAPGAHATRLSASNGASGLRKTPSPPLVPEARHHSSTVLAAEPSTPAEGVVGESDSLAGEAKEGVKPEESLAQHESSVPAAPILAAAVSEYLVAATDSLSSDPSALAIDGPAQSEEASRASPLTDTNVEDNATAAVGASAPAVASPGALHGSNEDSGPPDTASPPMSLTAEKLRDAGATDQPRDTLDQLPSSPQLATENSPEVSDSTSTREGTSPTATADALPTSVPPQRPAPTSSLPSAAPPALPLPPRVKVPTPPSAAIPLPPHVSVPLPPSLSPTNLPDTTRPTQETDTKLTTAAAAATPFSSGERRALSPSSSPVDVHTLSGAGGEEEEEDFDDDSFSSTPPKVVGGTVERTNSPPELRRGDEWSLFGAKYGTPLPPESTVPRYTASAMSSAPGKGSS